MSRSWSWSCGFIVALAPSACSSEPVTEVFVAVDMAVEDTTAPDTPSSADGDAAVTDTTVDVPTVDTVVDSAAHDGEVTADSAPDLQADGDTATSDTSGTDILDVDNGSPEPDAAACRPPGALCHPDEPRSVCCTAACGRAGGDAWRCGGYLQCALRGQPCTGDESCCEGGCNERGFCGTTGCLGADEVCADSGECCTSQCMSGTCRACKPIDQPCYADADCCSGYCNPEVGRCEADRRNCSSLGELCESDDDCCDAFAACLGAQCWVLQ